MVYQLPFLFYIEKSLILGMFFSFAAAKSKSSKKKIAGGRLEEYPIDEKHGWNVKDPKTLGHSHTVDGSEIRRSPPGMVLKLCK